MTDITSDTGTTGTAETKRQSHGLFDRFALRLGRAFAARPAPSVTDAPPSTTVAPPAAAAARTAERQRVRRVCACGCGHVHDCIETFREMVDRSILEADGSVILHDGAEGIDKGLADLERLVAGIAKPTASRDDRRTTRP